MYISPFWCGVIATIVVEIGFAIIATVIETQKEVKRNEKNPATDQGKQDSNNT